MPHPRSRFVSCISDNVALLFPGVNREHPVANGKGEVADGGAIHARVLILIRVALWATFSVPVEDLGQR
jgi:hypothetical protein